MRKYSKLIHLRQVQIYFVFEFCFLSHFEYKNLELFGLSSQEPKSLFKSDLSLIINNIVLEILNLPVLKLVVDYIDTVLHEKGFEDIEVAIFLWIL
jgi:hypothetical protein